MFLKASGLALLACSIALVLSGCYGSTEPATGIGVDHATFNGRGTANDGPAHVYFEYWPSAHPTQVVKTSGKDVPAGVSGPTSEPHFEIPYGLTAATNYSFRLCGSDRGAPKGVCAQTRTFQTTRPTGDLLRGVFLEQLGGIGHGGSVDAQSDPHGGAPTGTLALPGILGNTFSGNVTCLAVHGSDAAVGAAGTTFDGKPATGLLKVRDLAPPQNADQAKYTVTPGSAPPNCANATFEDTLAQAFSLFVVYDTP
jgi:hypothetical protein